MTAQALDFSGVVYDWHKDAVCASIDPELFYPNTRIEGSEEAAKQICRTCPVRLECLEDALSQPEDFFGIFGGFNPSERSALKRRSMA